MAYFDHAATTPLDPRLAAGLAEALGVPLNPSSIHGAGRRARRRLDAARERVAARLGLGDASLVIFTSGATEAANLALRGVSTSSPLKIACSEIEHSCVRDTVAALVDAGRVTAVSLAVGSSGRVADIDASVPSADVLCVMAANNETGIVQDVDAARAWRAAAPGRVWVCDATCLPGRVALAPLVAGADLVLLSGHKFGAPPGIGVLAGPGVARVAPQSTGGPQEDNRRAGTQAVALAEAMAQALDWAEDELAGRVGHLRALEARLLAGLSTIGRPFKLNGDGQRLAGMLNVSIDGFEAMDVVVALDQAGHCVSPGAACSTGVVAVSPVLAAMFPHDAARAAGGVRITMGPTNTAAEIDDLIVALARVARRR